MFEFESPLYLFVLFLPLLWAGWLVYWKAQNQKRLFLWNPLQFPEKQTGKPMWSFKEIALISGFFFCAIALANPRMGAGIEETKIERSDLYIALDISHSMNARDISPSRLEVAKKWVESLIQSQKGNRIGLLFFAGNAYLQMPLTFDYATAIMYCKAAQTEMAPTQGSSIADAIELVMSLHEDESKTQKTLVIVSDGEDHENDAQKAAKKLNEKGWVIFTMGAGTETGSEIPILADGMEDLARESDGSLAISKLNWKMLKSIASSGGGQAFDVRDGKKAIREIQTKMLSQRQELSEVKSYKQFTYFHPIFVGLALICFLFSVGSIPVFYKKNIISGFLILSCFSSFGQSAHSHLKNGDDLYEYNRFHEAAKQYLKAAEKEPSFSAYYNLGNSLYNLQKYRDAQQAFQQALERTDVDEKKANAYHNLGNTLFQQNQYTQSVEAYKKSLQHRPGDKETIENLLKARKLAKQQQKENQQNQDKNQQKKEDKNQDNQPENKTDDSQQNQQKQNQSSTPDQKNQKKNKSQSPLTQEEAEKLLDIIENEDKKVNKKIRRGSTRPSKPTKPW